MFTQAEAYGRFMGRYGQELGTKLADFAGVAPGMRALDVGCGPGALTSVLTGRLGADRVAGADPSEPFVEANRARNPGVELVVARAENLPFPDDAFDAALSQLVVNFMRDPKAGVAEMARVIKPGGVAAACVWDYRGKMTMLRAFWDAGREVDPEGATAADEARETWSDDELAELWHAVGLEDVRTRGLTVSASYTDFEDLWSPFAAGIGPAGAYCLSLDDARRAELYEAYRRRLGVGDDPFELTALAWAVAGTVGG
ncbi:MAG TPA: methyltransferase domain-containing protein [Gaiellaceae bacterium]